MQSTRIDWPNVAAITSDGDDVLNPNTGVRANVVQGCLSGPVYGMAYRFDRAISLRKGGNLWAIAYTNRETKAVVMKDGKIHRELNRSYYFASEYDYPIALLDGPDNRAVVAHCPKEFDLLELEDAESGETLDTLRTRDMEFHSRLSPAPNGRLLIDAGWFWHPWCGAAVFQLIPGSCARGRFA